MYGVVQCLTDLPKKNGTRNLISKMKIGDYYWENQKNKVMMRISLSKNHKKKVRNKRNHKPKMKVKMKIKIKNKNKTNHKLKNNKMKKFKIKTILNKFAMRKI
jgi:hypothetical protein